MAVGLKEFRDGLTEYVATAEHHEPVIIEKYGKPSVVLVSAKEFAEWQLDDIAEQVDALYQRYGMRGPALYRRLVLEKTYNRGDGSSKDEKLSAIKAQTDRIPDIEAEIAEIRQLLAPHLERLMSLEAARAVGSDSAENFDDEWMEIVQ